MVTQNMLRTQGGEKVFLEEKNPICDCSQMPDADQITEIASDVCTYFQVTILYKDHETDLDGVEELNHEAGDDLEAGLPLTW